MADKASNTKVYAPLGVCSSVTGYTTSTAATALPVGAKKVWLYATTDANIIFGDTGVAAAVVATCQPLVGGRDYILDVPANITHFRIIQTSAGGSLYVSAVG